MFQRSCIVVFLILTSFFPFAFGIFLNVTTLPGQHPDPEAVALENSTFLNKRWGGRDEGYGVG
ncbi:hypothetical protein KY289_035423 [Solanum tuberosum]|nr:hypothetical protein KY289_035423 [Solanum tuberosum]